MTSSGNPTILVIDDEESIRDGCRQTLQKSGYRVCTASDGQEGIHIAREEKPALAFVDLKMPHCSGMDIVEVLCHDLPDTALIMITGFASIVSAVEAMQKGAYDYLPKPFTPDQLRAVTRRALEHRALKLEAQELRKQKEFMEKNFITFVSHEMRSPLVTILQYIESLKALSGDSLGPEILAIIERCGKRAQNLHDLVEHWLDLSRIENGTFLQEKSAIDLGEVLGQCVEDMLPLCEKRGITLTWTQSEALPMIVGDRESLARVFTNIIGNATKYTPAGGCITIGTHADDYYVCVSVTDTGEGIPRDKLPFIFEPFYRARGKEDRHRGSGLGLTFCRKIMDAHSGAIEVCSQEGHGSTFTLKFHR